MNEADFIPQLIAQIMEQGYDRETAGRYAVLIGDMPCLDASGDVIVMDGRTEVARLKPLKMFEQI
jgi:hypothetical protein